MEERNLVFDKSLYSADALKKAAYRLLDKCIVDISGVQDSFNVIIRSTGQKSEVSMDRLVDEFKKEVLDQELRLSIKAESEPYRNLILAHVFSRTSLVKNE